MVGSNEVLQSSTTDPEISGGQYIAGGLGSLVIGAASLKFGSESVETIVYGSALTAAGIGATVRGIYKSATSRTS